MIGNVAVSQLFKKVRFKRAYSSCLPKFCRKWFPVTCTSNLESLSSWRNLRLWYVESALLVLANDRLVQKQLYTRNKVLNRFEALCGKSSLSTAFDADSKLKKNFRALTFYQATQLDLHVKRAGLNESLHYFGTCKPLVRFAHPQITSMKIDLINAYLHYPLPQFCEIVIPIIFSLTYILFGLA